MTTDKNTIESEHTDADKPKKRRGFMKDLFIILIPAAITLLLCKYVFALYIIPTPSMDPTIPENSFAVSWRLPYLTGDPTPEYGDIISFNSTERGKILIKRVVGLPGDVLTVEDGHLVRNGEAVDEPYAIGETTFRGVDRFEVPEGCVFYMGDNREHSSDSRAFANPYIPISDIQAKYLFSFKLPF